MQMFELLLLVQLDAVQNVQKLQVVLWSLTITSGNRDDAKVVQNKTWNSTFFKERNSFF